MYSYAQLCTVSDYLGNQYYNKEVKSSEIIVTLLAMLEANKLDENGIAVILMRIFKDASLIHSILDESATFISDTLVKEILENMKKN